MTMGGKRLAAKPDRWAAPLRLQHLDAVSNLPLFMHSPLGKHKKILLNFTRSPLSLHAVQCGDAIYRVATLIVLPPPQICDNAIDPG
jgi:hypothetical protein